MLSHKLNFSEKMGELYALIDFLFFLTQSLKFLWKINSPSFISYRLLWLLTVYLFFPLVLNFIIRNPPVAQGWT